MKNILFIIVIILIHSCVFMRDKEESSLTTPINISNKIKDIVLEYPDSFHNGIIYDSIYNELKSDFTRYDSEDSLSSMASLELYLQKFNLSQDTSSYDKLNLDLQFLSVLFMKDIILEYPDTVFKVDSCSRYASKIYEYLKKGYNALKCPIPYVYVLSTWGDDYLNTGNYKEAFELYLQSNEVIESLLDNNTQLEKVQINALQRLYSGVLNNTAITLEYGLEDQLRAVEYYKKSMDISRDLQDTLGIISSMINIGYIDVEYPYNYDEALSLFNRANDLCNNFHDNYNYLISLHGIGQVYFYTDQYKKAREYYLQAFLSSTIENYPYVKKEIAYYLGEVSNRLGDFQSAMQYLELAQTERAIHGTTKEKMDVIQEIFIAKLGLNNQSLSSSAINLFQDLNLLYMEEYRNKTQKQMVQYEVKEKEQKNKVLQAQNEVQQTKLRETKIIFWAIGIGVLLGIISVTIFVLYRARQAKKLKAEKDKTDQLNVELGRKNIYITKQKDDIEEKSKEIEKKNKSIMDSIQYAQRIQRAALPEITAFDKTLKDYFLFYLPKDVISGDFYWIKKFDNRVFITIADCTGHGVPGALMSMLGISFLNEIVSHGDITPDNILDCTRARVISSLKQTGAQGEAKDSMDAVCICIDYEKKVVEYSGANRELILFRDNKRIRYVPVRCPVGIYDVDRPFKLETIPFKEGDSFYLYSDGITDQFGGPKKHKFNNELKKLIQKISSLSMNVQIEFIENAFYEWKDEEEQIDDVLFFGFKM